VCHCFVSQSSEFCHCKPLCCFSSVHCCKCTLQYQLSPETFGYTLVCGMLNSLTALHRRSWSCVDHSKILQSVNSTIFLFLFSYDIYTSSNTYYITLLVTTNKWNYIYESMVFVTEDIHPVIDTHPCHVSKMVLSRHKMKLLK
jgi:hypothetical protein